MKKAMQGGGSRGLEFQVWNPNPKPWISFMKLQKGKFGVCMQPLPATMMQRICYCLHSPSAARHWHCGPVSTTGLFVGMSCMHSNGAMYGQG